MPLALVLINTEIGSEGELLETLRKMDVVEEAYMLYGVYDIVAKVNANSMEQLKDIIKWNIRLLDKVRSTTTMMVVDETK
jgi:DNA-binding Lrp family transcriptional regulator